MSSSNRIFSNLGIAQKAGKIASGEFACENAVKSGMAYMVIVAEDASDNTRKKMSNMTSYYKVPFYLFGTKEELGHCIGKEYRYMLAVLDAGFAKSFEKQMQNRMTTK